MQTIRVIECKQISSNLKKDKITYKLFSYKSYIYNHSPMSKQISDVKLLELHWNTWNQLSVCKQMINTK